MDNFLPGSDAVDKQILVILRDGSHFYGYLRTYDQFANLVLHDTIQRIWKGNEYGDVDRGTFLIRGENVVLLGQSEPIVFTPNENITQMDTLVLKNRARKQQVLHKLGFCADGLDNDAY